MNSIPGLRFFALAGVESAHLEGEQVVGAWKSERHFWYGPKNRNLLEEFANWPSDAQSILGFTLRYGPVEKSGRTTDERTFNFSLVEWREAQRTIHELWEAYSKIGPGELTQTIIEVVSGESVRHGASGIEYQSRSLWRFLVFSLCAVPTERLKKCARPDCPNRYFIAHHLGQRYCSGVCAQWRQKLWKRKWWKEHGKKWLEGRKRQKRENGKKKKSRKGG